MVVAGDAYKLVKPVIEPVYGQLTVNDDSIIVNDSLNSLLMMATSLVD